MSVARGQAEVADGVTLAYRVEGAGEPVVFVHGGFASLSRRLRPAATAWDARERELAARVRFLTYDRRGFGLSSSPADGYEIETQARDLAALLDALALDEAHVVGSSAGGPIALAFAALFPARTRSLVVVNSGFGLFRDDDPTGASAIVREQIRLLEREGPEAAFARRPRGVETSLDPLWSLDELAERGEAGAFAAQERELAALAARVPPEARIHCYAVELRNVRAYVECDGRAFAPRVAAPTLVLHGDRDRMVPLAWARELVAAVPRAELRVIRGGPHGLFWRSGEARAAAVEFVERHGRG